MVDTVVELEPPDETAAQLCHFVGPRLAAPAAPVITPGAVTPAQRFCSKRVD
jgi:hypothetical protein